MNVLKSLFNQRVTNFAMAAVLTISTLTGSVPFLFANEANAIGGVTTVTAGAMQGWAGVDDNGNGGSFSLVGGPADPTIGDGSAQLAVTTGNQGYLLRKAAYAGLKLSDITTLSYETYIQTGNNLVAPSMQINISSDVTTPNAWQGRLVYEPYVSSTVVDGVWQTQNAAAGKWWLTRPNFFDTQSILGGLCGQGQPCTLAQLTALYPNAGVSTTDPLVGFKAGGNWTNFKGNVDNVKINSDTYDFEATTPTVTGITQVYQPNQGGRIFVTLNFSEAISSASLPQGWNGSGTQFSKAFYSTQLVNLNFKGLNNNAGNYSFTVDKTAPTVIDIDQVYQTNEGGRVSVTLTFSEAIKASSLPQGWYGNGTQFTKAFYSTKPVTVAFTDLVGNAGTYDFVVDMTAPDAPVATSPIGWQSAFTKFTWTAVADAVSYNIRYSRTHYNNINDTVVNVTTNEYTPSVFADGPVFWQVQAVDAVGNKSAWSNSGSSDINGTTPATIDTTFPTVAVNLDGQTTNANQVLVTGTIFDANLTEFRYQVLDSAKNPIAGSAGWSQNGGYANVSNGTLATINTTALADGQYYVRVWARDVVGHQTGTKVAPYIATFTIDRTAPTAPELDNLVTYLNASEASKQVTWTTTDATVDHYEYREYINQEAADNNNAYWVVEHNADDATQTVGQSWGTHTLYYRVVAFDALGNESDASELGTIVIDRDAPVVTLADLSTPVGGNTDSLLVSGVVTDNDEIASIELKITNEDGDTVYVGTTTSYDWDISEIASGSYTVTLTATDVAGNTASAEPQVVVIDNTVPTVTIDELLALIADATPTVTGTYVSNDDFDDTTVILTVDGVEVVVEAAEGEWSYTPAVALAQGSHTFVVTAKDALGNTAVSQTTTTTIDTLAPLVTVTTVTSEGNTPTITGTAELGATLTVTFNGVTSTIANNAGTWTFTSPTALANGTYIFSITARDAALNGSTATSDVTVAVAPTPTFTVAPAITSPAAALGVTDDASDDAEVQGATTDNAAAVDTDATDGSIFGLAWYWWLLILAALASIVWFIIAAIRRRNEQA